MSEQTDHREVPSGESNINAIAIANLEKKISDLEESNKALRVECQVLEKLLMHGKTRTTTYGFRPTPEQVRENAREALDGEGLRD